MFSKLHNKIITIEGADGCGKDTLVDLLHKKYPDSVVIRFPDRNNMTGKVLNSILTKQIPFPHPLAFQSLMLANKIETLTSIVSDKENCAYSRPKLYFFCRYYESAMVYGLNDGIPTELSLQLNSVLPKSEMTFILDGKKYRADNEHYENTEVQDNLTKNYRELAKIYNWQIVDNRRTPEEISNDVLERIKRHIENTYSDY